MRCHNELNMCPYKFHVHGELAFNSYQQQERAVCVAIRLHSKCSFELKLYDYFLCPRGRPRERKKMIFLRFCSLKPLEMLGHGINNLGVFPAV